MAFQDGVDQHRETLAYYATFLSDVWHKPQKLSEWCGIRSGFWIMIHRKFKVKEKASEQGYRIEISEKSNGHGKNSRQSYPS